MNIVLALLLAVAGTPAPHMMGGHMSGHMHAMKTHHTMSGSMHGHMKSNMMSHPNPKSTIKS